MCLFRFLAILYACRYSGEAVLRRGVYMLGFYNYTVILTYFGMLSGFTGITCVLAENRTGALICLLIAGLCDMFDGKVASTMTRTRQEKRFGIQIDSLSDLICFGVLPSLIVFISGTGVLCFMAAAVYVLCALIRLAWFNVDEEERQDHDAGCRDLYYGLPVTMSALILPFVMGFCTRYNWNTGRISTVTLMIMAAAFLTPFKLKKPKLAGKIGLLLVGAIALLAVLPGRMNV